MTPTTSSRLHDYINVDGIMAIVPTSPRVFESWIEAGLFPKPDMRLGRVRYWRRERIAQWQAEQEQKYRETARG